RPHRHHGGRARQPRLGDAAAAAEARTGARDAAPRFARAAHRPRGRHLARTRRGGVVTRLAVVVPVYQEAAGITPTLRALAAQRDADFAVWFVDNGSTDGSADIIRRFAAERGLTGWQVIDEPQKGTGAAADTGMRAAIAAGATLLARTDADCLPREDWTASVRRALTPRAEGGLGLRLVGGELVARRDEGVGWPTRAVLRGAVHVAEAFGRIRPGNRGEGYLGPYLMAAGCNVGITAELYEAAGGFPRTAIEELHED